MTDPRAGGPWDVTEDYDQSLDRLDLGGLLVAAIPDVELQVQVDEATGAVALVTLAAGESMVQVQVFAAPRSGGLWDDSRKGMASSINAAGGLVEEATGSFGAELRAQVPADQGLQPARFVGVEGPRWFLRAAFLGPASRPGADADHLEAALRTLVVVRGDQAMPVGAPLALQLPAVAPPAEASSTPSLSLPERGPEITEVR